MKQSAADNSLHAIKEAIREEAEQARIRASQGELLAVAVTPIALQELTSQRAQYTIAELAGPHYTDFIVHAYSALLRRAPDSSGQALQIRLLEKGRSKIEILGNLRYSAEGREIGIKVPGLLPRYVLAKATSIPLLGGVLEWCMCFVGLPQLLHHQRAADTDHAAIHIQLRHALEAEIAQTAALHEKAERLNEDRIRLGAQLQQSDERVVATHAQLAQAFNEIRELRHLLLSLNHWQASLRQNLSQWEQTEVDQLRQRDALNVDAAKRLIAQDATRPARINEWAQWFAADLSAGAEALDIGSGIDWLQALTAYNLKLTGVDPSESIGKSARAAGIALAVSEPNTVLERLADDSLDALSILDLSPMLRTEPVFGLLQTLRRVLRPGGRLFVGFAQEHGSLIDRLEGIARVFVDAELIEQAMGVAGFVAIQRQAASDGTRCLIASNAEIDRT